MLNNSENKTEMWQVEVNGQVYEADFAELTQWIAGSSLLPEDKVKRGSLRWIEAKKVPSLVPFFNGKPPLESAAEPQQSETVAAQFPQAQPEVQPQTPQANIVTHAAAPQADDLEPQTFVNAAPQPAVQPQHQPQSAPEGACAMHPLVAAQFVCRMCGATFCRACPSSYGTTKICPLCGDMCVPIAGPDQGQQPNQSARSYGSSYSGSRSGSSRNAMAGSALTMDDFKTAWSYPLRFKAALILGGLLSAGFSFAIYLGMMSAMFGAWFSGLMAVLVFGVLYIALIFGSSSRAIGHIAYGKLDQSFMSSGEDFSIWDSILKPCFLGLSTCAVSYGPMVLVVMIFLKMMPSMPTQNAQNPLLAEANEIKRRNEFLSQKAEEARNAASPGTKAQLGQPLAVPPAASEGAAEDDVEAIGNGQADPQMLTDDDFEALINGGDPEKEAELAKKIRDMQTAARTGGMGGEQKTEAELVKEFARRLASVLIPFLLFFGLAALWAFFYFPVGLTVAGYTQSIGSTLNPAVGFDTIKRMRGNFGKAFGYYALLILIGSVLYIGCNIAAIPFAMMGLGVIASQVLMNLVCFYLYMVTACLFGLALYRSHESLGYSVD
jgi:hypothetical protein